MFNESLFSDRKGVEVIYMAEEIHFLKGLMILKFVLRSGVPQDSTLGPVDFFFINEVSNVVDWVTLNLADNLRN